MITVAIYLRVSTVRQADRDSLPAQKEVLTDYAKTFLGATQIVYFEDAGISGTTDARPAFERLLTLSTEGLFNYVLVFKLDRFSRNFIHFMKAYQTLSENGVRLISYMERFDTGTPVGQMLMKLCLIFAEMEIRTLRERVHPVMAKNAELGRWNGGVPMYGLRRDADTGKIMLDPKAAPIVKKIFEEYIQGKSMQAIADELKKDGVPTMRGGTWSPGQVRSILRNPSAKGAYVWNRRKGRRFGIHEPSEWIERSNSFPGIVPDDVFREAQDMLDGKSRPKKKVMDHLYQKLLFCAECGALYISHRSRSRKKGEPVSDYVCGCACPLPEGVLKYTNDRKLNAFILRYIRNILESQKKTFPHPDALSSFLTEGLPGPIRLKNRKMLFRIFGETRSFEQAIPFSEMPKAAEPDDRILQKLSAIRKQYLFGDLPLAVYIEEKKKAEALLKKTPETPDYARRNLALNKFMVMKIILSGEDPYTLLSEDNAPLLSSFLHQTILAVRMRGDQVRSIQFRNGITHQFEYPEDETE